MATKRGVIEEEEEVLRLVNQLKRVKLEAPEEPTDDQIHVRRLKHQNKTLRKCILKIYDSLTEERRAVAELKAQLRAAQQWSRQLERNVPPDLNLSEPRADLNQSFG